MLQKYKTWENLGFIWKKNFKKRQSSQKLEMSFEETGNIFSNKFPTRISVEILRNFLGNFKKLKQNFRENIV